MSSSGGAALNAYVSNFEDIRGVDGELITMYVIQVEHGASTYALAKRYSDFSNLYTAGK